MKTQFKLSSILLAMSFAFSANVMAKTVFDPSNFKKNTITAVQQVKQTRLGVYKNVGSPLPVALSTSR
jgi:conjugal transfer/entry exclusion protein